VQARLGAGRMTIGVRISVCVLSGASSGVSHLGAGAPECVRSALDLVPGTSEHDRVTADRSRVHTTTALPARFWSSDFFYDVLVEQIGVCATDSLELPGRSGGYTRFN
jgi:hypothetical protein